MEKTVIERFYHKHPLILAKNESEKESNLHCYGCGNDVAKLEVAYVCRVRNCSNRIILHKKCGDLPSQISHPKHPHPLHLFDYNPLSSDPWCDVCMRKLGSALGYKCSSCNFDFDITCPKISIDALLNKKRELSHPSHPHHPLTLMRKSPSFPFYCDGCGDKDVDMAYICSICEIWVHKRCALLPPLFPKNRHGHHHHDLTLAFSFPTKHRKYISYCDVCHKRLNKTYWVYFCGDCRFFAHLQCVAFTTKIPNSEQGDGVIKFPLHAHDIAKKLITPFVDNVNWLRIGGRMTQTTMPMPQTTASFSFLFNYHKHHLRLVKELSNKDDHNKNMMVELIKICDVCVTPISSSPYYECARCRYFVHSTCYSLPEYFYPFFSSPLFGGCETNILNFLNHAFKLYTTSELDMDTNLCRCKLCGFVTNGRVYQCVVCKMMIDVKCAALPLTIRSHLNEMDIGYCCTSCEFGLHVNCAMLPASTTMREWDRYHSLMLLSDAARDHPSDFICDFCEGELHPKRCMYHCRQCDVSFHLRCLKTASGELRNIKFGRQFKLDKMHPDHPLTFSCVTIKRRCDICNVTVYDCCGFECELCYFAVCLSCGGKELANKM
ncbi:uncharacterized protein LOC121794191 isoform X2 [Salvia splendens]|uniref:uncharacterized protein LOC121794191 isoform X2 n=1 Tax=Salvia splendens TaxID=180675 RepID=UPI001C28020A|nr:uncharacterized protein LOC121794191 isoform X2 [Salvia splendens]